jgi:hypothetical protein
LSLKAGRPTRSTEARIEDLKAKLEDEREKRLNVRMPYHEYRALQRFAFEHDRKISDVVRDALREYMSK